VRGWPALLVPSGREEDAAGVRESQQNVLHRRRGDDNEEQRDPCAVERQHGSGVRRDDCAREWFAQGKAACGHAARCSGEDPRAGIHHGHPGGGGVAGADRERTGEGRGALKRRFSRNEIKLTT